MTKFFKIFSSVLIQTILCVSANAASSQGSSVDYFGYNKSRDMQPVEARAMKSQALQGVESYYKKSIFYANSGNFPDAIKEIDKALKVNPQCAPCYGAKAIFTDSIGRAKEALTLIDKAIELDPSNPKNYNNKAVMLNKDSRYAEALKSFDKSLELDSNELSTYLGKAFCLIRLSKREEAFKTLSKAQELDNSQNNIIFKNFIVELIENKRSNDAIFIATKAIKIAPDDAQLYYLKGNAYYSMDKWKEAISFFDQSIAKGGLAPELYCDKGLALSKIKSADETLAFYESAIMQHPSYACLHFGRGATKSLMTNNPCDSLVDTEMAVKLEPSNESYKRALNSLHSPTAQCASK